MLKVVTPVAALCLVLAACSGGSANSRLDYREIEELPGLEVPPDLTVPENTGLEEIPQLGEAGGPGAMGGGFSVLPTAESIRIEHDGALRWLRIDVPAEQLWPKLREFWPTIGLEVAQENPATGIMETGWAENRADAPTDFFSNMVKKVFKSAYSADTRDKYRLRLEPREDGSSELFVTHYGLKEVIATRIEEVVETAWEVRPSDPELANEVMNRMVLFLGGTEATAQAVTAKAESEAQPRARLEGDTVIVNEGFSRTWRRTGIALDRQGMVIEDRNRSAGIYYVGKLDLLKGDGEDEGGWFSGLFSSEEEKPVPVARQIELSGDELQTRIRVLDETGNPDTSEIGRTILQRLQEALK